jgi:hypothetical protein
MTPECRSTSDAYLILSSSGRMQHLLAKVPVLRSLLTLELLWGEASRLLSHLYSRSPVPRNGLPGGLLPNCSYLQEPVAIGVLE